MRIVLAGMWYPCAILRYYEKALRHMPDVELLTVGPTSGGSIPWGKDFSFPEHAFQPDFETSFDRERHSTECARLIYEQAIDGVDLWLDVDAGLFTDLQYMPWPHAVVATDSHCVAGDTMLATCNGILTAREMADWIQYPSQADRDWGEPPIRKPRIRVADKKGMVLSDGIVLSGYRHTRRITLETGQRLVCTDDHLIETPDGFRRADELGINDEVVLACGTYEPPTEGTEKDYSIGFVLGAFQGDGSFSSSDYINFTISKAEEHELGLALREHLERGFEVDHVMEHEHYNSSNTLVISVRRWGFRRFLKSCHLKTGHVPLIVRRGSRRMIAGYIAGLFATDGCSYAGRLQMSSKWGTLTRELQTILFYMGIPTSITERKKTTNYSPNRAQRLYTLYIRTGAGTQALAKLVGKIPGKPFRTETRRRGVSNGRLQGFKIAKIEGAVKNFPEKRAVEPVYDVTNTTRHTFLANGISVHNCLDYSKQREVADFFFNMHPVYSEGGDIPLPYCYSEFDHYPEEVPQKWDVTVLGLQYMNRMLVAETLVKRGCRVYRKLGDIWDDYRRSLCSAPICFTWSSRQDAIARVYEGMACKRLVVCNRVPDLRKHFVEGEHFIGFSTAQEAVSQIEYYVDNPVFAEPIAEAGYRAVKPHTYTNRLRKIFEITGVVSD